MGITQHFRDTKYVKDNLVFHNKNQYDWNIDKPNFIYMKLCKTAGTSIFRGLIRASMSGEICHIENEVPFNKWLKSITDKEIIEDYFKFTFVRNPFDRLVSAYIHLELGITRYIDSIKNVGCLPGSPISFENFIKTKLVDDNGIPRNEHWAFQHHAVMTEDDKEFIDYVGRFENIKEDWKTVANRLGFDEYLPFIKPGSYEDHNPIIEEAISLERNIYPDGKDYRGYYTDELIEIVSKIYKKDLEVFGYEF